MTTHTTRYAFAVLALVLLAGCDDGITPVDPNAPKILTDCYWVEPSEPPAYINGQRTQAYVYMTERVVTEPSEINVFGERDLATDVVDEDAESYSIIYKGRAVCGWRRDYYDNDGNVVRVEGSTWEAIELVP